MKLLGAGSLFVGLGAIGIPSILKNINGVSAMTASAQTGGNSDIRPFHVNVPEAELTDLCRRINATRWPEKELVTESVSQGVAARDYSETRELLGYRLRLAQGRSETEGPATVHYKHRWAGYSFHPRSLET